MKEALAMAKPGSAYYVTTNRLRIIVTRQSVLAWIALPLLAVLHWLQPLYNDPTWIVAQEATFGAIEIYVMAGILFMVGRAQEDARSAANAVVKVRIVAQPAG